MGTELFLPVSKLLNLSWCHQTQGRTDHLETQALPESPGSVGGPMRCLWYLFHRLFLSFGKDTGAP
ncbi:unnamed protein product [Staurois parvus]|uniref:Uncharacterized protein n=1 Tax=Staurois parvus TaxID=386267 RepID=A0ABN9ANZ3_9NEOB|nr:unnamed protein product [Staurois parvus]